MRLWARSIGIFPVMKVKHSPDWYRPNGTGSSLLSEYSLLIRPLTRQHFRFFLTDRTEMNFRYHLNTKIIHYHLNTKIIHYHLNTKIIHKFELCFVVLFSNSKGSIMYTYLVSCFYVYICIRLQWWWPIWLPRQVRHRIWRILIVCSPETRPEIEIG